MSVTRCVVMTAHVILIRHVLKLTHIKSRTRACGQKQVLFKTLFYYFPLPQTLMAN